VVGNELIAAPGATLVGVFRYRARLVRLPPGEGQIVSWAGQVVRGWGQRHSPPSSRRVTSAPEAAGSRRGRLSPAAPTGTAAGPRSAAAGPSTPPASPCAATDGAPYGRRSPGPDRPASSPRAAGTAPPGRPRRGRAGRIRRPAGAALRRAEGARQPGPPLRARTGRTTLRKQGGWEAPIAPTPAGARRAGCAGA
jgi:hypothetical protein